MSQQGWDSSWLFMSILNAGIYDDDDLPCIDAWNEVFGHVFQSLWCNCGWFASLIVFHNPDPLGPGFTLFLSEGECHS